LVCVLIVFIGGCDSLNPSTDGEEVEVGIYNGNGSWDVSVKALTLAVTEAGFEVQLFNENDVFENDIKRFRMIIFPGGNPQDYSSALSSIGIKRVQNYINFGGNFFGVGGGAAIADIDSGLFGGIGIFDGDAVWPINQIAQYPESVLTEIVKSNDDHPISRGMAEKFTTLYRWGPYFIPYQPDNMRVIFDYVLIESPAMVSFTFGMGRVVLAGFQPEIEENDDRDGSDFADDLYDPESEWEMIEKSIEFCLGELF